MFSMIGLIQNENMKIYRRVSAKVMIIIMVVLVIASGLLMNTVENKGKVEHWKESLIESNERMSENLSNDNLPYTTKQEYEEQIQLNNYRIEHNIQPINNKSLWDFMEVSAGFISLITLFTVIVGAGIVANEFSWGSIKLLLIRPASRTKVLLSKYLATLLFSLSLLVILFVSSFVTGGILFGFDGAIHPYLVDHDGSIIESSLVSDTISTYGFQAIDLLMIVTFAFMISTVFRNSSISIGLAIFFMFTSSTIILVLSKYEWIKYILFTNMNLRQYVVGNPYIEGMTMNFSIMMLAIYFIIFNFISWLVFNKRDVSV